MKTFDTIIQSIVTEKASNMQSRGQYTFVIRRDATKVDVKQAIKAIYGADVDKVRIALSPKKTRLLGRGRLWTKRPVFKKAIVALKGGKSIDPNKLGESKEAKKEKKVKEKKIKAEAKKGILKKSKNTRKA